MTQAPTFECFVQGKFDKLDCFCCKNVKCLGSGGVERARSKLANFRQEYSKNLMKNHPKKKKENWLSRENVMMANAFIQSIIRKQKKKKITK